MVVDMAWSIAQVARMSKVTSRTLRHYDEIGLLPPAWVGGNGYRYYEQEQLLRLQQILVMRELGVGLDAIAEIVHQGGTGSRCCACTAGGCSPSGTASAARADRRTDDRGAGGGENVSGKSMDHWFEGFDSAKQAELQEEARQRWGAENVDAANEAVKDKPKEWWQSQGAAWAAQVQALVDLIDAGHEPGDPEVLSMLDGHYRWLSGFWTPNRESYTGLGDLYADDPRFRANFDKTDPRLAEFLRAAMAAYALDRL